MHLGVQTRGARLESDNRTLIHEKLCASGSGNALRGTVLRSQIPVSTSREFCGTRSMSSFFRTKLNTNVSQRRILNPRFFAMESGGMSSVEISWMSPESAFVLEGEAVLSARNSIRSSPLGAARLVCDILTLRLLSVIHSSVAGYVESAFPDYFPVPAESKVRNSK